MGIIERKERDRQEMQQRIVDAAMQMFLEEGYEKTSLRNIAERIEYSPATIYLYFKDKDEMLYEVQRQAFEKLSTTFQTQVRAKDPFKRLEEIAYTYVHFGKNNPELYDLMFIIRAPMKNIEEKKEWSNGHDAFEFLLNCIKECMDLQLLRFENPMIGALSVWAMGHGLVSLDIRCRFKVMDMSEDQVEQAIQASLHEYLRLIRT